MELKRRIDIELWLVFGLSLGRSVIYSILALADALTSKPGLSGSSTTINQSEAAAQWLDFFYQLFGNVFQLVPVALVFFFVGRGVFAKLGITKDSIGKQFLVGLGLTAAIGLPGIALYLGSRALGLAAKVVVTDVNYYFWTIPMLLVSAAAAGILEETIMIGYLFHRLRERGMNDHRIIWLSAIIRGSYHLYQGFGGFLGNLIMGVAFGYLYKRTSKLVPLLFAHFMLDAVVFVGYPLVASYLPLN